MLSCYITSLQNCIFEGEALEIQVPGSEGSFGVLSGHEKFISAVDFGELTVTRPDKVEIKYLVWKGVFQVVMDRVVAIVDFGVKIDEIDIFKVKKYIQEDKDRIKELKESDRDDADLVEHIESRITWYEKLLDYVK